MIGRQLELRGTREFPRHSCKISQFQNASETDVLKSCTTWHVWNLINDGINYQPQLVMAGFLPSTVFWGILTQKEDAIIQSIAASYKIFRDDFLNLKTLNFTYYIKTCVSWPKMSGEMCLFRNAGLPRSWPIPTFLFCFWVWLRKRRK